MKFANVVKLFLVTLFLVSIDSIAKTQTTTTQSKPEVVINNPEIYFENTEHDFDTITKGSSVKCEFTFQNTGNEPLALEKVKTSCECTVPKWPKKPILPGKSGVIKVIYSTRNVGYFYRTIAVISNAKTNPVELHIKGTVINK